MVRYVGIDLHKRLLVAHILDAQGNTLATAKCEPVTAQTLAQFAQRYLQPDDQLALEVTTHCWAVVRFLLPAVARIVVSNPMATKAIASAKVKTDKVDTAVLNVWGAPSKLTCKGTGAPRLCSLVSRHSLRCAAPGGERPTSGSGEGTSGRAISNISMQPSAGRCRWLLRRVRASVTAFLKPAYSPPPAASLAT